MPLLAGLIVEWTLAMRYLGARLMVCHSLPRYLDKKSQMTVGKGYLLRKEESQEDEASAVWLGYGICSMATAMTLPTGAAAFTGSRKGFSSDSGDGRQIVRSSRFMENPTILDETVNFHLDGDRAFEDWFQVSLENPLLDQVQILMLVSQLINRFIKKIPP